MWVLQCGDFCVRGGFGVEFNCSERGMVSQGFRGVSIPLIFSWDRRQFLGETMLVLL